MDEFKTAAAEIWDTVLQHSLSLAMALFLLIAGFIIAGWVSRTIRKRLAAISKFDRTLIPILAQLARYAILVFTGILVLAEFGVQTTSMIAVLGAAGLAIGLALQGTLQNVAAGMMLLLLRPFRVGDFVEAGSVSGTVDEIGMFMTRMHTAQGIFVAVPNSSIWSGTIYNYSMRPQRRLDLTVGISYEDDIDKARTLILDLATADERVATDPGPVVLVKGLGDSSVDLQLRAWIRREQFWDVNFELTRAVKYALDEAGISIPYPHRQVVVTGGAAPVGTAAND